MCHSKDVSPDTLLPNRFLRTSVTNFRNKTGYTKAIPTAEELMTSAEPEKAKVKEELEGNRIKEEKRDASEKEEQEKDEPELILEVYFSFPLILPTFIMNILCDNFLM